jgi:anti-anti-sigma regulatory factor
MTEAGTDETSTADAASSTPADAGVEEALPVASEAGEASPVAPGANRFDLPAQADIRFAADIHAHCRAALDATGDVEVGCGDVERLDGAVLQCLISLHHGLAQGSRGLVLVDPSPAFERALALTGAGPLFDGVTVAQDVTS